MAIENKNLLLEAISDRRAKVGVIGLGCVGLPLVSEFCRAGFPVMGFDIDETKVAHLNQCRSYIGILTRTP